jgi:hypothetical protein
MMSVLRAVLIGTTSGAAATVALNIVTYADMALRGRPASEMPAKLVKNLAASAGIEPLAADDETAANRRAGIGALLGYANGIGAGLVYGALRPALPRRFPLLVLAVTAGAAVMAMSDVPATKAHATDPSAWGLSGWIADIIPHAVFGLTLAATFDFLERA